MNALSQSGQRGTGGVERGAGIPFRVVKAFTLSNASLDTLRNDFNTVTAGNAAGGYASGFVAQKTFLGATWGLDAGTYFVIVTYAE